GSEEAFSLPPTNTLGLIFDRLGCRVVGRRRSYVRRCFLGCMLSVNCRRFGSVRSRAIGGNLARCPFLLFRLRLGRGYGRCVSQIRTSFCRLGLGFCRLGLPGLYAAPPLRFFRERLFG